MLELDKQGAFLDLFVKSLVARSIRNQEDLVEQLFDSCEIRVARALLLLADFGKEGRPKAEIPMVSHEALAGMAGTTRWQVRFFMRKFRRPCFIVHVTKGLQIHNTLLNVVLQNLPRPNPESRERRQR